MTDPLTEHQLATAAAYEAGHADGRADAYATHERAVDAAVDNVVETARQLYPADWRRTALETALLRVTKLRHHQVPATAGEAPADRGGEQQ